MAQIIRKKSWNIDENLFEGQALSGRISTSNTLDVTLKTGEHLGGINIVNVSPIKDGTDVEIDYNLIWTEYGPISGYTECVKLSDIAIARPVIVHFERTRGNTNKARRNGEGVDTYIITINTKKGEVSIEVDSDEFICIMRKTASGDRRSAFGYIKMIKAPDLSGHDKIVFHEYVNTQGVFSIRSTVISVADIVGIFKYKVELKDYIPKTKESEEDVSE